jgi:hypothetical protein
MFASKSTLLAGCVLAGLAFVPGAAPVAAQSERPDFASTGWLNEATFEGGELIPVEGSPPLFRQDPAHPFVPNNRNAQPTYRIADLSNPNVKQWAKDVMKKDNDEVLRGKIAYTARSSCHPAGVPGFDLFGFQPVFFFQTPEKVVMIYSGDQQVRHVYLNVPHSKTVKPSWYGESVGRYEGDTLVVDTIGQKTHRMSVVDAFGTPHTEQLHVVERFQPFTTPFGKALFITVEVVDPGAFTGPWKGTVEFRQDKSVTEIDEVVCAENNRTFGQGTTFGTIPQEGTPPF